MLGFSDKIRWVAEFVFLAAVPPFSKEFCELDGILAKGRRVSVHLADTVYEIGFCRHSAAPVTAINPISIWHTDAQHVVKILGVPMFFPKIRTRKFRKLFDNTEHGPQNVVQCLAFDVAI